MVPKTSGGKLVSKGEIVDEFHDMPEIKPPAQALGRSVSQGYSRGNISVITPCWTSLPSWS